MPIEVSAKVLEGITAVRDSGATNMLDRNTVAKLASDMGYYDAANWIVENRGLYAEGVFQGFQTAEENADAPQGGEA